MKESEEQTKKRASKITDILSKEYPDAKVHLNFKNPFQLLISTILAAQCTDVLVNMIMDQLYKKYKTPADFANADPDVLEEELSSISFFRNKTKSVQACCKMLIEKFSGKVPGTMEDLISLPGVGRKTANCVLANCFDKPAIITDTHVIRVSGRFGFTENDNGDKVEKDLIEIIPEKLRTIYSVSVGEHGRQVCRAKKPKCEECATNKLCPSAFKV
jgi:endonuclease-3